MPKHTDFDTIVAIATPYGRGGVGVVRVSGLDLSLFILALLGKKLVPRYATLSKLFDADNHLLDQVLAIFFISPHSYTGEDVLELHGHGSPVGLGAIVQRCLQLGARLALPGEFTQRAFLNDKIDLAQAEAVADLIDASSVQAVHSAMRSLNGEFSLQVQRVVDALITLRGHIEAMLDFPEEAVDFLHSLNILARLQALQKQLLQVQHVAQQGSLLREGIHVVLIGQPNVGKSSLLNRLAGEELAIVTEYAGTTRDTIHETVVFKGVSVNIIDTAGLRDTQDPIEKIGIARTWQTVARANVALLLMDAQHGMGAAEQDIIAKLPVSMVRIYVHNKADLLALIPDESSNECYISAKTGFGIASLVDKVLVLAGWQDMEGGVFMARQRHVSAIVTALKHMDSAAQLSTALELMAEELRNAQLALSDITGRFGADDLLGEIFSSFCIGK